MTARAVTSRQADLRLHLRGQRAEVGLGRDHGEAQRVLPPPVIDEQRGLAEAFGIDQQAARGQRHDVRDQRAADGGGGHVIELIDFRVAHMERLDGRRGHGRSEEQAGLREQWRQQQKQRGQDADHLTVRHTIISDANP